MWLVYFRFDDQGEVQTYHIRTGSKDDVRDLLARAERHGLTPTARLVEYAAFSVSGTIKLKPMMVPNFHFYEHAEFLARWHAAEDGSTP
jgi:hypothetical protein